MITCTLSGPPLTESDIVAFEREIGCGLPDDYRTFLLAVNGGFPQPPRQFTLRGQVHEFGKFLQIAPDPSEQMRLAFASLQGVAAEYLPIADVLFEPLVCIDLRRKFGAIVLASFEDAYPGRVRITPLASSFSDFLSLLEEQPVDAVVELGKEGTSVDLDIFLRSGRTIDDVGKYGYSILCEAIKYNNQEMVVACLERGACLRNALHLAVQNSRVELLELLIDAGADINETDETGAPPAAYVEEPRRHELVAELVRLGAAEVRRHYPGSWHDGSKSSE